MRAMAAATLGPAGASVVSVTYLALSYALLTAYSAKVADLTALTGGAVPPEAAQAALSAAFFGLIFAGGERAVESVNAALTKLLLLLFAGILAGTAARADWGTLAATADWDAAPRAISIAFLSLARARPLAPDYWCQHARGLSERCRGRCTTTSSPSSAGCLTATGRASRAPCSPVRAPCARPAPDRPQPGPARQLPGCV